MPTKASTLGPGETALALGLSARSLRRHARAGRVPVALVTGRGRRYSLNAVAAALADNAIAKVEGADRAEVLELLRPPGPLKEAAVPATTPQAELQRIKHDLATAEAWNRRIERLPPGSEDWRVARLRLAALLDQIRARVEALAGQDGWGG